MEFALHQNNITKTKVYFHSKNRTKTYLIFCKSIFTVLKTATEHRRTDI